MSEMPTRVRHGRWFGVLVRMGALWLAAAPVAGLAQPAQSLLDRQAGLNVEEVTIAEALRALQRSSGVPFAFSPDLLRGERRVTCRCRELTVRQALDRVLDGTDLQYQVGRRQILVGRLRGSSEGIVTGVIVEAGADRPVPGADVQLLPAAKRTLTGDDGRFVFRSIAAGTHELRVHALGYERAVSPVAVEPGAVEGIRLALERAPIPLAEIVIAPGSFGILDAGAAAMGSAVSREDIEAIPQIGDDVFRTLKRMPGVASGDISAKLSVRGGTDKDLLVRLDGLELYEPYHMKDADGVFGIVDVQSLGGIELITGGFPADFGAKWGGVFNMRTRPPPPSGTRTTVGMSLSSLSVISQGSFGEGRGQWITSLRRGFLEYVLKITDVQDDFRPTFWDVLGKAQYLLNDNHVLSLQVLHAGDEMVWEDTNEAGARVVSAWNNSYGWATWNAALSPRVRAETMLSVGRLSRDRTGIGGRPEDGVFSPIRSRVFDLSTFRFGGFKQDWQVDVHDAVLLKAGIDVRTSKGEYDYAGARDLYDLDSAGRIIVRTDSTDVETEPTGTELGAYTAVRVRTPHSFTWEAGLRFDRQSHTGDRDVAPRFLLRWDPDGTTSVKGSVGRYFQSQGIHELQAMDGESRFSRSELADQVAIGVERRFGGGVVGRAEGYLRRVKHPQPHYANLTRDVDPLFEVEGDRTRIAPTRARAKGLEFLLSGEGTGPLSWWTSYTLAATEQEVGGRWVPQTLDQRHTFNLHAAYRWGRAWQLSGSWQYHTGWPVTEQLLDVHILRDDEGEQVGSFVRREFGPLNADRLPPYHRLDVRLTRNVEVNDSRLEIYLDVFNAYNRENVRGFSYDLRPAGGGLLTTVREPGETMLPILPTVGFRWLF